MYNLDMYGNENYGKRVKMIISQRSDRSSFVGLRDPVETKLKIEIMGEDRVGNEQQARCAGMVPK